MIKAARKQSGGMSINGGAPVPGSRPSGRGATQGKTKRSLAMEIWSAWVSATARPDDEPDKKIMSSLQRCVADSRVSSAGDFAYLASYMTPEGDRDDVKRLHGVLRSTKKREEARMLAGSSEQPILYSPGESGISMERLCELTGSLPVTEWNDDDIAAANKLRWMTEKTILGMAATTRTVTGYEELLPSDIVAYGKKRIERKPAAQSKKRANSDGGYSRGESFASKVQSGELIEYDLIAYDKIINGENPDDVIAFHNMAPAGFWDDVVKQVQQGATQEEAYANLAGDYPGFNPLSDER